MRCCVRRCAQHRGVSRQGRLCVAWAARAGEVGGWKLWFAVGVQQMGTNKLPCPPCVSQARAIAPDRLPPSKARHSRSGRGAAGKADLRHPCLGPLLPVAIGGGGGANASGYRGVGGGLGGGCHGRCCKQGVRKTERQSTQRRLEFTGAYGLLRAGAHRQWCLAWRQRSSARPWSDAAPGRCGGGRQRRAHADLRSAEALVALKMS